jgi:AcrR family transcriptional regulator
VIAERGVAGTRLADVAERIGVSPPALLYWFDSKEQLLAEALVTDEESFYVALGPRLEQLPDARKRLALLISAAASSAEEFSLWLELWNWSLRDPDLAAARARLDQRWRAEIERVVRDGREAGAFGGLGAEEAALTIASLLDGLTVQVRLDRGMPPERMVEVATRAVERLLDCSLPTQPLLSAEEMGVGAEA